MSEPVVPRRIGRLRDGWHVTAMDDLAAEEPLEIVLDGQPYAVTMRLPGDDEHLVLGFLYSQGVIASPEDVASIRYSSGTFGKNRLHVDLRATQPNVGQPRESRMSMSGCGLYGTKTLEQQSDIPTVADKHSFEATSLVTMRQKAESLQALFARTGATHFAALFDGKGDLLAFAEDLGRHNALDKVIGRALAKDLQERSALALVSSRLSVEMVQKAGMLGVEILAGMSVATNLAAELAESLNMTLVGRLRETGCNVYCGFERIHGLQSRAESWAAMRAATEPSIASSICSESGPR